MLHSFKVGNRVINDIVDANKIEMTNLSREGRASRIAAMNWSQQNSRTGFLIKEMG